MRKFVQSFILNIFNKHLLSGFLLIDIPINKVVDISIYSSPQFSPAFSEPPSPWADDGEGNGGPHSHYNQRNTLKMEADETLANNATISCVLYANINHPEWKKEYPSKFFTKVKKFIVVVLFH